MKIKVIMVLFCTFILSVASDCYAWDNHTSITYHAFESFPYVTQAPAVSAEPLDVFLSKEQLGLVNVLAVNEQWAQMHVPEYPRLPDALVFKAGKSTETLQSRFLASIRVNPEAKLFLYAQTLPSSTFFKSFHKSLSEEQVSLVTEVKGTIGSKFETINPGEKLPPLIVVSSAADEPDYGLDTVLWDDNKSAVSAIYHWGNQPFGDINVSYSSQAPFHMAFWHETSMLYKIAPSFHKSFLEYRVHTYLTLSRYAFMTHHPYWGWRFLGWALHYVQDLSQPYHSTLIPGVSTFKLLLAEGINLIGFNSMSDNLKHLLVNRHLAFENYVRFNLSEVDLNHDMKNHLYLALHNFSEDSKLGAYTDQYLYNVVSQKSYEQSSRIDKLIRQVLPNKYTNDLSYFYGKVDPMVNLYKIVKDNPVPEQVLLDEEIAQLFRLMGGSIRNIVRATYPEQIYTKPIQSP